MARRVNKDYVEQYNKVILIQPLANGKVQQICDKVDGGWLVGYLTDTIYHVCPYDGVFRACKDCGALEDDFDINYCLDKQQVISSGALSERVNDCLKAGLDVRFID